MQFLAMRNLVWPILFLSACLPDREFEIKPKDPLPPINPTDSTKSLKINEIVSSAPDWVELYNAGTKPVVIKANTWFLTDKLNAAKTFTIPLDYTIPPGSFFIISCVPNPEPSTPTSLNTNLGLSSNGDQFGISRQEGDSLIWVDSLSFPAIPSGSSFGRSPDGGNVLKIFSMPTKGATNS